MRLPSVLRATSAVVSLALAGGTAYVLLPIFWNRLDLDGMTARPLGFVDRFETITGHLRTWPLESWASPGDNASMKLAFYLRDCTDPADRVFISQYMPQVPALAQRAFAGGHGDLRPSFYTTAEDQRLTISRLQRQRVPVVIMPAGHDYEGFKKDFPRIDAYLATHYQMVGDVDLGDAHVRLLASREVAQTGIYRRADWPCFR